MNLKRCSVSLCDIRFGFSTGSLPHIYPVDLRKLSKINAKRNNIPVDDLSTALKRRRTSLKMDPNKENVENESSEEEGIRFVKPKKRIVKTLSDSEVEDEDVSNEEEEQDDDDDDDYDEDDDDEEDDGDSDDSYEIRRVHKVKKKSNVDSIPKHKKSGLSSYEKMIEQKRAERLAFLESLKINEVKSEFSDVVNTLKRPVKQIHKKKDSPVLPLRKSSRLSNFSMDFSEKHLFKKVIEKAELETEIKYCDSLLPSKLPFTEALSSEGSYESYIKDVKVQESQSTAQHISYDRSVIRNLTLEDSNIAYVVPERLTSLAWYPSVDYLLLAAGSKAGNISIWNVDPESSPHVFKIHSKKSTNLQFDPFNPVKLFSSSNDGTIRCGDMVKHIFDEIYNVSHETSCTYFDFVSAATYIVALMNGQIALLDKRSRRACEKRHVCHDHPIKTVHVHPLDRNCFVTAEKMGHVCLWDLRKLQNEPVVNINHHKSCVNSAFFSNATGNSILTTSLDGSICIFDCQNLTQDIKVIRQMKHIKNGRDWLTTFKAMWLPNSDKLFAVGGMEDSWQSLRRIQVYDKDMNVHHSIMHKNLTAKTSMNTFHPLRPALAGCPHTSGKVFVFT